MATLFVTGLCFQGNKGGPAIALSLIDQLRQQRSDLNFVFAVPGGAAFAHEKEAAARYGVRVTEAVGLKNILPPFALAGSRWRRVIAWVHAVRQADAVLDMTAISYVGPPVGSMKMLLDTRFLCFVLTHLANRPFLAWTQSYGPFSTKLVAALARMDLKRLPLVFCRGTDCQAAVEKLLPGVRAISFPDVATALPFDHERGRELVQGVFGHHGPRFVSLSPSAVIYSKKPGEGAANGHVADMVALCRALRARDLDVLLVPHTLRVGYDNPRLCDLAVCRAIRDALKGEMPLQVLEEDLSPGDLKAAISCAHVHVGARYHSIVAALSAGVPAVSLSWHPKYRDLMREYGQDDFVFDAIGNTGIEPLLRNLDLLLAEREERAAALRTAQVRIVARVAENAQLCATLFPR